MTIKSKTIWLPSYWNDLSDAQKDAAFNGVGPEHFPQIVRNMLDKMMFWNIEPVYVHDVEYTHSDSKTMADFRFLINSLLYAGLDIYRLAISLTMFLAVLLFGGKAWRNSRKK